MVEIIEIDGCPVSMIGDYFETLLYSPDLETLQSFKRQIDKASVAIIHKGENPFLEIKSSEPPDPFWISELEKMATKPPFVLFLPFCPFSREVPQRSPLPITIK